MKKIGFVTPWYGENISGGAEMELRSIVNHLAEAGFEIEMLTTCVKDFNSDWNIDYHKPGEEKIGNVLVKRFSVRKRNVEEFDQVNYKLMNNMPISDAEEQMFMKEMVNSPDLYEYIKTQAEEYSFFIFMPYMFGTTYYGIQACPEKSILIPCFHDESYIYMKNFKPVFERLKGVIYHSKPEMDLANTVFDFKDVQQELIGGGVHTEWSADAGRFAEKYNIKEPFIMYAGRKDAGKNVDTLLQYFAEYKNRNETDLKLVLIGGGSIDIPKRITEDVYDLGFIPMQDKYDAYAAALLLCQPSQHESFSLVIMESWLCNRPVIVSAQCEVTKNFAIASNGGLYFDDYFEFEGAVNYIRNNSKEANQMGQNGHQYVTANFEWNVIVRKYVNFFEEIERGVVSNACDDR